MSDRYQNQNTQPGSGGAAGPKSGGQTSGLQTQNTYTGTSRNKQQRTNKPRRSQPNHSRYSGHPGTTDFSENQKTCR